MITTPTTTMGYTTVSSTPSVVRRAVGVGGAVWVDRHRVIHNSHTTSKRYSPDGYRLGSTPSQYCIKPTQQNRVVLALQILPTCHLNNYVILVLKQSTGTFFSRCPLKTISVSSRTNVLYEYLLSVQVQIKSSSQINTAIILNRRKQLIPPTQISHFHAPSNPFRQKSDFGKGRCSRS